MKLLKISFSAVLIAMMAFQVHAQDQTQAVELYNKGLEQAQANEYDAAISTFTRVISMGEQLGPEGEEVKNNAESQIPKMYFAKARALYQNYQRSKELSTLEDAIDAFKNVIDVSEEYGDDRYTPTARGAIPQLYYAKSVLLYSEENYEVSEQAVDEALNLNSNYAAAYYQKAKIFKKVNDTDGDGIIDQNVEQMLEWYDRAIDVGQTTNKGTVVENANEAAHDELLAVGTRASEANNLDYAFQMLETALNYNAQSADVYYRLAEAHNKAGNPEEAIEAANNSLEYETGGRTDKAKIYFELGYAHQTLGNKAESCDAFSNAVYGQFKSAAEHKMEFELKCDSATE
ncbi:tetratricopeptide repeat protein [Gracilimonas sp.]|uniref:tetratricopeptide repeat protein n=1 Tax=Gracilimonas sp. TaxID=1974203 RepID=UPI0028724EB8|nr:tetratricopeptide repeat protein [Gracilimonas sp.]